MLVVTYMKFFGFQGLTVGTSKEVVNVRLQLENVSGELTQVDRVASADSHTYGSVITSETIFGRFNSKSKQLC